MGDIPTSIRRRTVQVLAELRELAPRFLAHRRGDADCLREALDREDFEAVRAIGHTMKGSGSAYGFDDITTLGAEIERLARAGDAQALDATVTRLIEYLENVDLEFI
jgi:HPt (histidine-containing phosphotransfer) domain-containing protein